MIAYVIARYRAGDDLPTLFDVYADKQDAQQLADEYNADAAMIGQPDDRYLVAELRPLDDTEERVS